MGLIMSDSNKRKGHAEDIDIKIGARLRKRRRFMKITQPTLCKAIDVSQQQMGKYETGQNRIPVGKLNVLAKILGVPITYFLGEGGVLPHRCITALDDGICAVDDLIKRAGPVANDLRSIRDEIEAAVRASQAHDDSGPREE